MTRDNSNHENNDGCASSEGDTEQKYAECYMCRHPVTPYNPAAKFHICGECMLDIQVGDRYDGTGMKHDGGDDQ